MKPCPISANLQQLCLLQNEPLLCCSTNADSASVSNSGIIVFMLQPDAHQPFHQQSEAPRQVTTPNSIGAQALEVNSLNTHRQPAVSAHCRASSGWPLDSKLQQDLLSANAPARPSLSLAQPEWPTPHWHQAPGLVTTLPQCAAQSYHPHPAGSGKATAPPSRAGPVDPLAAASLQHYPTRHSLPHQRPLPSNQWVHSTGGDMLQMVNPLVVPQSSMAASANPGQPSWGMPSGSGREALYTPDPAVGNPTSPWTVPAQLRSEPTAVPAVVGSLTAAPTASSWAVSQPNPQSLPPRHPTQGLNPDQPASHPFLGQPSRPASRCDHPLYAHLDLSRPLCLQQSPAFGLPGTSESYRCSSSPFCAQGQEFSMQQKACISVSDAPHVQHPQLHDDSQYQQWTIRPGMSAMHAHQHGHGLVAPHPEQCGGQAQPWGNPHNADGVDCIAPEPQHGRTPRGVTLQATVIACCVDSRGVMSLPVFGIT